MKIPRIRIFLLAPVIVFAVAYVAIAIRVATYNNTATETVARPTRLETIAIFGATGTAGDGILKAALANPDIKKIHIITRRENPRIADGVASGKIAMTKHTDYLDYAAILNQVAEVDAVFWAIGLSSIGVDEQTYRRIHIQFPRKFVEAWASATTRPTISFHYISSSDISEDSSAMWARVKVQAENTLFDFAKNTNMRVIAYRPDYIGPTEEEANIGQSLLFHFFSPLGAAVKATQIGQAMMEVALRGDQFVNGDKLSTRRIISYSDAYEQRSGN